MINGVLGAAVWGEFEMPMLPNCFSSHFRRLRYRELLSECVHALLDRGGYRGSIIYTLPLFLSAATAVFAIVFAVIESLIY